MGWSLEKTASNRRARRRKLVRHADLREAVIAQRKENWSPKQIAGRLAFEGQPQRVSHETIYAYVYGPERQSNELARHLLTRRKKRRRRYVRRPRGFVFPPDRSIYQRPNHVKTARPSATGRAT